MRANSTPGAQWMAVMLRKSVFSVSHRPAFRALPSALSHRLCSHMVCELSQSQSPLMMSQHRPSLLFFFSCCWFRFVFFSSLLIIFLLLRGPASTAAERHVPSYFFYSYALPMR